MKNYISFLFVFIYINCISQYQYTAVNDTFYLQSVYPQDSSSKDYYDVNKDFMYDIEIESWFNHSLEEPTSAVILRVDNDSTDVFLFGCSLMSINDFEGYNSGFVYNSKCNESNFEGDVLIPFNFKSWVGTEDVIMSAYLDVTITDLLIIIHGFNYDSVLKTKEYLLKNLDFKYYTLQGKKTNNPKGLVLKKYSNGTVIKTYIN